MKNNMKDIRRAYRLGVRLDWLESIKDGLCTERLVEEEGEDEDEEIR